MELGIQVVRAKKRDTGVVCALKIMNKMFIIKQNRVPCAKLERLALDQLDHPGIVRLLYTFRDTSSLCRYSFSFDLHLIHYPNAYVFVFYSLFYWYPSRPATHLICFAYI